MLKGSDEMGCLHSRTASGPQEAAKHDEDDAAAQLAVKCWAGDLPDEDDAFSVYGYYDEHMVEDTVCNLLEQVVGEVSVHTPSHVPSPRGKHTVSELHPADLARGIQFYGTEWNVTHVCTDASKGCLAEEDGVLQVRAC